MITRLVLNLPWYLSAPALLVGAVFLAVGLNVVAGGYFERRFRDDADPLADLTVVPATQATSTAMTPSAPAAAAPPSDPPVAAEPA